MQFEQVREFLAQPVIRQAAVAHDRPDLVAQPVENGRPPGGTPCREQVVSPGLACGQHLGKLERLPGLR